MWSQWSVALIGAGNVVGGIASVWYLYHAVLKPEPRSFVGGASKTARSHKLIHNIIGGVGAVIFLVSVAAFVKEPSKGDPQNVGVPTTVLGPKVVDPPTPSVPFVAPLPYIQSPPLQISTEVCDDLVTNLDDIKRRAVRTGIANQVRNPTAAVKACTEAIASDPTESRLRFQRGLAYEAAGDIAKGEADFQETEIEAYPPALARRARLLFSGTNAQKREAILLFKKAEYGSADAMYWIGHFEYTGIYSDYGISLDKNGKNKMATAALLGSDTARRDPASEYRSR